MKRWIGLSALLLAACTSEPTSYLIDGADVSITVERTKPYFWSRGWELSMVVRRNRECQRRYDMKAAGEDVKIDLFTPEPGVYIMNQGSRWYVTELQGCGFQAYQSAPPEPGDLLGSFQEKGGVFKFVESKRKAEAKPENE